jgi:hypothetical protein
VPFKFSSYKTESESARYVVRKIEELFMLAIRVVEWTPENDVVHE